jgi:YesN/AraC family two-component response regulator
MTAGQQSRSGGALNITIKVLIIEDEPAIARGLSAAVSRYSPDFDVVGICRNGYEGIAAIIAEKPQMVFTDIRMPVMDGLAMIEQAVKLKADSTFIILSGYEQFEYARTALSLGVKYYLLKPVNVDELYDILVKFKCDFYTKIRRDQILYLQSVLYDESYMPDSSGIFNNFFFTVFVVYTGTTVRKITVDIINDAAVTKIEKKYDVWVYAVKGRHHNECIFLYISRNTKLI